MKKLYKSILITAGIIISFGLIVGTILYFVIVKTIEEAFNPNTEEKKEIRISGIKQTINFDFGDNYFEIENFQQFHPDWPTDIILEFNDTVFNNIVNHIKSLPPEKHWIINNEGLNLYINDWAKDSSYRYVEIIELEFKTKRLTYSYGQMPPVEDTDL